MADTEDRGAQKPERGTAGDAPGVEPGPTTEPAPPPRPDLADRPTQLDTRPMPMGATSSPEQETAAADDAVTRPDAPVRMKQVTLVRATDAPAPAEAGPASAQAYLGCVVDGRYKIESLLGRGGMGVVYGARHLAIDRSFAIKILLPTEDIEVVERFLMEARAASAIGNEHIVDIVDFGELPDGSTYFVMEQLEGSTLSKLIRAEHFLPIPRILNIGRQIAEGIGAAHAAEIVHRDLKPENIFITRRDKNPDFVKLLDFGIAKVAGAQNKLTRAGTIFGTPHYMSPEQAAGSEVDHHTDIYSLGVILYEMASGRVPFDAENPMGLLTQHMYTPPVPLTELEEAPQEIPPAFDAVVLKCLSKTPEQRYPTMDALIDDLEKVAAGQVPDAVEDLLQRTSSDRHGPMLEAALKARQPKRSDRRWMRYVGGAALALAGAGLVATRTTGDGAQPEATPASSAEADAAPARPRTRSVALVFSPIDAEVFRGDRNLGGMPVTIPVPEGKTVQVEVRRDGFYPETAKLDGSQRVVVVELRPIPGAEPTVPVPEDGLLEELRRSTTDASAAIRQELEALAARWSAAPDAAPADGGRTPATAELPAGEEPAPPDLRQGTTTSAPRGAPPRAKAEAGPAPAAAPDERSEATRRESPDPPGEEAEKESPRTDPPSPDEGARHDEPVRDGTEEITAPEPAPDPDAPPEATPAG